MKKIHIYLASLLLSGSCYAMQPCNGFQIVVKNNTPDKFYTTDLGLTGANIQPKMIEIHGNSEVIFTVNDSEEATQLNGDMVFKTFNLPSKKVHISFDLDNQGLICSHTDKAVATDYTITDTRLPGKITYYIGY